MTTEQQSLTAAIAGLEAQRALLGAAVVDLAVGSLRAKLAALLAAQPAAPVDQTLRQVSVLFLDIVGSTALSQHLDPEDIHAVLDGTLARCTVIVEAHGGRVLQYAGDNLLAVFGADTSEEDDAERAVLAGLALLAEGRARGEQVLQRHGQAGFDVRVGVHTGGVLLGGGVDAEGSIRGLTVNIAARMEQTAPAGGLRVSHDTWRHVRGVFDVEPQAPIDVKGVDAPIASVLVLRARPRAFRVAARGIEGVATRMVGRDAELEQLQAAFLGVFAQGRLMAVTVVAEAGIGKSRLMGEFQNWADGRPETFCLFQGRAHPQTRHQPYGLLRDVLAWRLQIADGDSMALAKQKLEQGIAPLFAADEGEDAALAHAHLLGHLIGLDFSTSLHIEGIKEDGRQVRHRGFRAAAQVFRRLATRDAAPIVLLLDDLHWADDASLDFLQHLVHVNADVPMLVLGLTRPTLFERRADWPGESAGAGAAAQRIELAALDRSFSRALADELLKKLPEVPEVLRERVTGGAEGNPFYMEELVKMLVDEGAISLGEERWTVHADKLLAAHVPPTLTSLLQARLDGVKPAEKLALQQASVIGFVFWDEALNAIDAHAAEALPGVTRRALVTPRRDAGFEGVREYAFSHQILHHVTYDTVLKRRRREYHAKTGEWLARLAGARANDFLGIAAEHFEQAGDKRRACEFFARAAEHARERFAHESALGHVAQALALLDEPTGTVGSETAGDRNEDGNEPGNAHAVRRLRWRLLEVRERTLGLQGRRAEQRADLAAMESLAEALADDRLRFEVAWRRCDIALRTADYAAMEAEARHAAALAERVDDRNLGLRAQQRLAIALGEQGDLEAGKAMALQGLAESRSLGLRRLETLFLNVLSVFAGLQDDPVLALRYDEQKLPLDKELGNPLNAAITIANHGESWLQLGEVTQARHWLGEGLRLTRAYGDRAMECTILLNLTQLELWAGEGGTALALAQSAVDLAVAVQNPESEARALCARGHAELAQGNTAASRLTFGRAHGIALADDSPVQHDALAGMASVAGAQGDMAAALRAVETLLAHLERGGTLEGTDRPRLVKWVAWQVLAAHGDARANAVLAAVHAELQGLAGAITDPVLRHGFLHHIPEHCSIVAAWATGQPASPDTAA